MSNSKALIPNLITLANLVFGVLAIKFIFINGDFYTASLMIFFGGLMDFFDGTVARLLKVNNPIGVQLDSLADLVTFGLAPAFMVMNLLEDYWFVAILIVIAAAYRLAKFNVDSEQKYSFRGLPTPANALFFIGLTLGLKRGYIMLSVEWLIVIVLVFSLLMVIPIWLLSLKFEPGEKMANLFKIFVLILGSVSMVIFKEIGLSLAVLLYIGISILFFILKSKVEKS